MRTRELLVPVGLLVLTGTQAEGLSDADKCEAAKNKIAGKYAFCRLKAEAKAIRTGDPPDYTKCTSKFDEKWNLAETDGGGMCPDNVLTAPMNAFIAGQSAETAAIISGAQNIPACGDNMINVAGEQCDGTDLGGETCASLGFNNGGTLVCTACLFDTSGCKCKEFLATGQTTAYTADKNDGIPGAVAVPDDGTLQLGAALTYVDNADGTLTDPNTGLMWEKKFDDGGLHDWDNLYRWSGDGSQETIWDWLDDVNAEGGSGFAGHNDWRIPNQRELESIIDHSVANPAVDLVFHIACAPGCTLTTCSCTKSSYYWSSSTGTNPAAATGVDFLTGYKAGYNKSDPPIFYVRAVRGGL